MERGLYTALMLKLKEHSSEEHNDKMLDDLTKVYSVRKRHGTIWDEIYKIRGGKVIVPEDEEARTVLRCHRKQNKCLTVPETAINMSSTYEISPDQYGISLGLISSVINTCPFCSLKNFVTEKPVLVRWSNGMLYKAYVLARDDRLCFVELDNYSTAVLDMKDVFDEFEHEMACTGCHGGISVPPNEIVLCDCCNVGFHQKCHSPPITDDIVSEEVEWFCSSCLEADVHLKPFTLKPQYNLSTLACMAILDKGPCSKASVLSWIQGNFEHYKDIKSDRWKARLLYTMSTSRHWIKLNLNTGNWDLCQHNMPTVLRHLTEVTKDRDDIPISLSDKIPQSADQAAVVSPSFSDVLPYDVYSLTWDTEHRTNEEGVYCYCMGNGVWYKYMLQCISCSQWFHQACVTSLSESLLCGEMVVFVCSVCNMGEEHLTKLEMSIAETLHLIMYHTSITKYRGDFSLPICMKMHVLPLLEAWVGYTTHSLADLITAAKAHPELFELAAKHRNTTLFKLKVESPPHVTPDPRLTPPLPATPQGTSLFLPPGFVVDLRNNTSGLQVDGSPPEWDYPPSPFITAAFAHVEQVDRPGQKKQRKLHKTPHGRHKANKIDTDNKQLNLNCSALPAEQYCNKEGSEQGQSRVLKRLQAGEKYRVLGRRVTGDLGYLVAWEGVML